MIAANDPQEFIPGGRQQAQRHPDPPELQSLSAPLEAGDDFLQHRLERVKLDENAAQEWWTLRKSKDKVKFVGAEENYLMKKEQNARNARESAKSFLFGTSTKSHSDLLMDDSWTPTPCELSKKRISDITTPRLFLNQNQKRFSNEFDQSQKEMKSDCPTPSRNINTAKAWVKFRSPEECMEEELYVKGNLIVWSCGLSYNAEDKARSVICCYSSYFPLIDAVWCTFQMENPDFGDESSPEWIGEPFDCLCIADTQNLRVYTKDDENFTTTLPFRVRKLWPTKLGIFIERSDVDQKEVRPLIYSLTHPLDIVTPLAYAKNGSTKILQSENVRIVFTSDTLDICMLYDDDLHQHFVCRIRRVRMDELDVLNKTNLQPSMMNTKNITSVNSMTPGSYRGMFPMASPFSSRPTSAASNSLTRSRGYSLLFGAPNYHASSRCHTPMSPIAGNNTTKKMSLSPWMDPPSRLHSTVRSDCSMMNRFPNMEVSNTIIIEPTFCLDHVWSEVLPDASVNGAATNVFLSEDLMGQWYLCYLVPARSQLTLVKFDYSNNSDDMVFGKATSLSAKDGVAVPHLRMLAVLEHTSNVVLYSGVTMIGKLHIGGTLAQHVPSPYAVRKSSNRLFHSPFPRRSSLLPTSVPDPRFDEHMLSPVMPTARTGVPVLRIPEIGHLTKAVLIGLKDSIDSRITLQYSDGSYYRVSLPNMAHSALIEDCLNAVRVALPRDLVMTTLAKWYACKNLPGNADMSQEEEWRIFTNLMFELLGYHINTEVCKGYQSAEHTPSSAQVKRQRQSDDGTLTDWNILRRLPDVGVISEYLHFPAGNCQAMTEGSSRCKRNEDESIKINTASLFPYIRIIHYVLHLVYEDLKLNTLRKSDLNKFAVFLAQLASDLHLEKYAMHYWKDFPGIPIFQMLQSSERISQTDLKLITKWSHIQETPPNILAYIHGLCLLQTDDNGDVDPESIKEYPVIANVNTRSKHVVELMATYLKGSSSLKVEQFISIVVPPGGRKLIDAKTPKAEKYITRETSAQRVVLLMIELGVTTRDLETYPLAVNFILYDALWRCRIKPPTDWPPEAYNLLQRPDLAAQSVIIKNTEENISEKSDIFGPVQSKPNQFTLADPSNNDGMEEMDNEVLKLRFSTDQRVQEARNLLQSSKPVPINIVQRPDVSDHDHLEEQEKQLYAICTRTMALPVGRGMFTLHTSTPVITEPLPVPPLCLTGKAHPRGTTVELTHIDTPSNMAHWPQFHNGVANGLRISPSAKHVDSTWIVFNKPKAHAETMMEHAGFLMALGLNGHLRNLDILNRFDYLSKFHEMTSVGILLGLSAAFRGTCNKAVTKTLCLHVEGLLPPTSIELDVPQNLQVASLLGIGMLYQGSAHRRMIEVMLSEIGRPPGPEMENSIDRQSYSLAAGLGLGLITLRQGGQSMGLSDLTVPDTLHYYMVGGSKRPLGGTQKEKYKVSSFQIREGATVNLDVTAPGATLALGLMYLGTGNKAIAGWMAPPDTHYLLDFVRPDFLMLRTLCRSLILWNEIDPVREWVEGQVPDSIRPYCMVEPDPQVDLDYEAMNQAYCNIIAGACFAIGLKYAGSADEDVFELLLEYCHMFACLTSKTIAELAGKPTMETCLNVVLISVAMVMAGTGNIEVIRIVRYLRRRVGLASSAVVTYGSHLAMHMALGLLFLGGGRYTLSNSPTSIAALICAFYPKFPTHSNDNRYHLQAFRHLYVLAAEARLVIPTDIVTGKMCYAYLNVVTLDGRTLSMKAPALIPDLNTLYKVSVQDQRYWPVVFEKERNWDQLLQVLSVSGRIDVKQRAGCLSYTEDKTGFRSDLARTLTESDTIPWDPHAKSILSFSSDVIVRLFADQFLTVTKGRRSGITCFDDQETEDESESSEVQMQHAFTQITYESVIQDKLAALPLFIQLIEIVKNLLTTTTPIDVWHLKIVHSFSLRSQQASMLINDEFLLALHQKALTEIDNWETGLWESLKAYVLRLRTIAACESFEKLAKYVAFYNIPYGLEVDTDILSMMLSLQEKHCCDAEVIDKVLRILCYVQ